MPPPPLEAADDDDDDGVAAWACRVDVHTYDRGNM